MSTDDLRAAIGSVLHEKLDTQAPPDAIEEAVEAVLRVVGHSADSPLGYVIAGPGHDGPEADWDGIVHQSREDGEQELLACQRIYSDWGLYELRPVSPEAAR